MTAPAAEEIRAELKGAREQLQAARLLFEKHLVSQAVSAAYYGIFHAARAALWTRGKTTRTHRGLSMLFHEEFIKTHVLEPEYRIILDRSRDQREKADYDLIHYDKDAEEVQSYLQDAERFVKKINELIRESK